MTRTLSFAALAGFLSLTAACGGGNDEDVEVITPPASTAQETNAPAPQQPAATRTAFVKPTDPARPALTGKEIFDGQCAHCHAPGDEGAGTLQLAATRGPEYAVLETRTDLTSDYVKYIVRHGLNAMPPFKPTTITDAELDELAGYLAKAD